MAKNSEEEKKREIAESLFGAVLKAKATGAHEPDRNRLLQLLEGPGSVIHSFCEGCGYYSEFNREGAEILAKMAGVELPISLDGFYFETRRCSLCDGKDETVSLKRIK
jgi:hypothetical protein